MFAPGADIAGDVDAFAVGPGLGVEIGDLWGGRGAEDLVVGGPINDSWNGGRNGLPHSEKIFEDQFGFALYDYIRARVQIFFGIVGWLGAAQNYPPAALAGFGGDVEHVAACHQVAVDAHGRGRACFQNVEELGARSERGIVNLHIEALGPQVRGQVQDSERRVGLHDLKLLGIFPEEVAVRQEEVHDLTSE